MSKIKFFVADPSGNITILVLTPCSQKDYQRIAGKLLACKELKGEQVGFIKNMGQNNVLEMAGMEFCGNAGRTFGLYCAREQGYKEPCTIMIKETGSAENLSVQVEPLTGYTKIKMPMPVNILPWTQQERKLKNKPILVDLGGIVHVILQDEEPSQKTFESIKKAVYQKIQPSALGVIFYNAQEQSIVPVVYVKSIDTTYWESSCGSGSQATALALAFLQKETDGYYEYKLKQPAGIITAGVEKSRGKIQASYIEGPVILSSPQEIEI